ncbi:hypothetical protein [Ottowia testudinis]|uniref:Uncharacterized protein n=1 Tax=Ottowia testudinis TaxID=2816950 RepID=A0A975H3H3_9BURK|nr:hypothetical protein [Ottowia testudinis]QTD45270.1 hypothetical protein J1M35_20015 [Ottowia testudinis]
MVLQKMSLDHLIFDDEIFLNKTNSPLLVLCESPNSQHTSVILFPPYMCFFAAVSDTYAAFYSGLRDHTFKKMITNDDLYKSFLSWMRSHSIKKDYIPNPFFSSYSGWGGYGSSRKGPMGKKFRTLAYVGKVCSAFVENQFVEPVVGYFSAQIEQFKEWAFIFDERSSGLEKGNEICALKNLNYCLDGDAYKSNLVLNNDQGRSLNAKLRKIVEQIECDERVFPNLPLPDLIRSGGMVSWWMFPGEDRELARERAILRSRIIKKLSFPWFYRRVADGLSAIQDKKVEAINTCGEDGFNEITENLGLYMSEIKKKYPIVDANPFA